MPEKASPFFDRPYVGQPFIRRQNGERYEEGQVAGIKIHGTFRRQNLETGEMESLEDWSAVVDHGFESQWRFDARTKPAPGGWAPLESDEAEKRYGPGYMKLRARVDTLTAENEELRGRVITLERERAALNESTSAIVSSLTTRVEVLEARGSRSADVLSAIAAEPAPSGRRTRVAASG